MVLGLHSQSLSSFLGPSHFWSEYNKTVRPEKKTFFLLTLKFWKCTFGGGKTPQSSWSSFFPGWKTAPTTHELEEQVYHVPSVVGMLYWIHGSLFTLLWFFHYSASFTTLFLPLSFSFTAIFLSPPCFLKQSFYSNQGINLWARVVNYG